MIVPHSITVQNCLIYQREVIMLQKSVHKIRPPTFQHQHAEGIKPETCNATVNIDQSVVM